MAKNVYSIDVVSILNDEYQTPMYLCKVYTDEEEAIADAKKYLDDNIDNIDVLEASVCAGQTMTDAGDVLGEPYEIWTGTNTSRSASKHVRRDNGYLDAELDYYAAEKA